MVLNILNNKMLNNPVGLAKVLTLLPDEKDRLAYLADMLGELSSNMETYRDVIGFAPIMDTWLELVHIVSEAMLIYKPVVVAPVSASLVADKSIKSARSAEMDSEARAFVMALHAKQELKEGDTLLDRDSD